MSDDLRQLVPGDETILRSVFSAVAPDWAERLALSPAGTAEFLASDSTFVFVVTVDDVPAGVSYGSLMLYPDGRPMAYLHQLEVAESFRRRGLATRLITASMDWARTQGAAKFWLSTGAHNVIAQSVYDRLDGDRKPLGDVNYWWTL